MEDEKKQEDLYTQVLEKIERMQKAILLLQKESTCTHLFQRDEMYGFITCTVCNQTRPYKD